MRVVGAQVDDTLPERTLKAHPNIGLQILDEMPEMNVTVGIRQSARDEETSGHGVRAVIALSARQTQPRRERALRGATRRAACALAALAALSVHPARALAQQRSDPWWGPDKALHFGVSAGIAAGGYGLGALLWKDRQRRALAGATLALGAGAGKELWDLTGGGGSASWRDLVWDAAGAALGVGLALSVDFGVRGSASEPRRATLALSGAW